MINGQISFAFIYPFWRYFSRKYLGQVVSKNNKKLTTILNSKELILEVITVQPTNVD